MVGAGHGWRALLATAVLLLVGATPAMAQDGSTQGSPASPTTTVTPPTTLPPSPEAVTVIAPPVGAGRPVTAALEPLAEVGYEEHEVFLEGTATVYGAQGVWGRDGRWGVRDTQQVPYRTRLLVRRPANPDRFSGTVFVSWLNVNAALDHDADWAQIGEEIVREGGAWVGVSAQSLGITSRIGALDWDPARYGSLALPGDGASYDVFTHAAEALRRPGPVDPLGGLPGERRLIAVGQSQSAQRLVTYLNAFQPDTHAYDGFLLVSRFRGAAPLGQVVLPPADAVDPDGSEGRPYLPDPLAALLAGPLRAKVRDDTTVPVFTVLTETEARRTHSVVRPDGARFRTWEIAGSSHLDRTALDALSARLGRDFPQATTAQLQCPEANAFPAFYALRAATRSLATWVAGGAAPATAPPLQRDPLGALVRDGDGNVLGGLRLPQMVVPTARHSGAATASGYCALAGSTVPFTRAELAKRYPTPEAYAAALSAAVREAVRAGYLLAEDAADLLQRAPVPGSEATVAVITAGDPVDPTSVGGEVAAPAAGPAAGPAAQDQAPEVPAPARDRSWMATTGRDLITPLLVGLLLTLNGRVVLTIAQQRRRSVG